MTDDQTPTQPPRPFRLLDISALVVGYGLASLLVRAFWPANPSPPLAVVVAIGVEYAWLGLAMSGPIIMAAGRRDRRPSLNELDDPDEDPPPPIATWAENAWILIGVYWICLTILVVPSRLHRNRPTDVALLGFFPIAASLVLRYIARRQPERPAIRHAEREWPHRAAVGLILTWPVAWVILIALGKTL